MRALAVTLALLCGCKATPTAPPSVELEGLAGEEVSELATTISDAVSASREPGDGSLAVSVAGPVGLAVEADLRRKGFAMDAAGGERLSYAVASWDGERVLVSAELHRTGWRADSLWLLTAAGEWLAVTPMTTRGDGGLALEAPDDPRAPYTTACEVVEFAPVSLRANVARELADCGYRIGKWHLGDDGYVEDWLIEERYTLTVRGGVRGVLTALREQYGIASRLRPLARRVDFIYREERE